MIPHVTNHDDADITELEAFRVQLNKENEKSGIKVTMLAFLIKACVAALKKFPDFNASLDGDQLVYKQYFHIGFAADTPNGLMVPVLRDADNKGIFQISTEMGELAKKAREGKLSGRDERRLLFHQLAGRHWRHLLHAHHQRARGGHPGRVQVQHPAGVGRQGLRAAPDTPLEPELGPPRHRRRVGRALQTSTWRKSWLTSAGPAMTTVVVVKKAGQVAIAADTLVTFGDTRLANRFESNSKLFKVDTPAGPSYVGVAGTVAHFPVLRKAMVALPRDQLLLGSRDEVFDTFTRLHPLLKEPSSCRPRKTTTTRTSPASSPW